MGFTIKNNPGAQEQVRAVQVAEHGEHADNEVHDFPRIEKAIGLLPELPPGRLLDIGYCKGSFADYLAGAGWRCLGLDLCQRPNEKVRAICCDIHQGIPLVSESFELITAGEVIEHMIDEGFFLQECHRLLRKQGWLVVTTPNLSYSLNRLLVFLGRTPLFVYQPYHYHFHTLQTLTKLVEGHGFKIHRVSSSHVLYSRRRHFTGRVFEILGDIFPTFGAHLIVLAQKL